MLQFSICNCPLFSSLTISPSKLPRDYRKETAFQWYQCNMEIVQQRANLPHDLLNLSTALQQVSPCSTVEIKKM